MGLIDRFKKEDTPAAPVFQMRTNFQGDISRCTLADVKSHLRKCLEDSEEFLVLEPEAPVQNTQFLQAAAGPGKIIVECSVRRKDGSWALLEKLYGNRELTQVEGLFDAYFRGEAPDTGGWKDTGLT